MSDSLPAMFILETEYETRRVLKGGPNRGAWNQNTSVFRAGLILITNSLLKKKQFFSILKKMSKKIFSKYSQYWAILCRSNIPHEIQ